MVLTRRMRGAGASEETELTGVESAIKLSTPVKSKARAVGRLSSAKSAASRSGKKGRKSKITKSKLKDVVVETNQESGDIDLEVDSENIEKLKNPVLARLVIDPKKARSRLKGTPVRRVPSKALAEKLADKENMDEAIEIIPEDAPDVKVPVSPLAANTIPDRINTPEENHNDIPQTPSESKEAEQSPAIPDKSSKGEDTTIASSASSSTVDTFEKQDNSELASADHVSAANSERVTAPQSATGESFTVDSDDTVMEVDSEIQEASVPVETPVKVDTTAVSRRTKRKSRSARKAVPNPLTPKVSAVAKDTDRINSLQNKTPTNQSTPAKVAEKKPVVGDNTQKEVGAEKGESYPSDSFLTSVLNDDFAQQFLTLNQHIQNHKKEHPLKKRKIDTSALSSRKHKKLRRPWMPNMTENGVPEAPPELEDITLRVMQREMAEKVTPSFKQTVQEVSTTWSKMQSHPLTDEAKMNLEALKMRAVLDPTRHYKQQDHSTLLDDFQFGTVMAGKFDTKKDKMKKKEKRKDFVHELLSDKAVVKYADRVFKEINPKKST